MRLTTTPHRTARLGRLARLGILALAIQLSGVPHEAVDLLLGDDAPVDPCEVPGHDACPPVCTHCLGEHGVRAPVTSHPATLAEPHPGRIGVPTFLARAPDEPDTNEIFLPPRS